MVGALASMLGLAFARGALTFRLLGIREPKLGFAEVLQYLVGVGGADCSPEAFSGFAAGVVDWLHAGTQLFTLGPTRPTLLGFIRFQEPQAFLHLLHNAGKTPLRPDSTPLQDGSRIGL